MFGLKDLTELLDKWPVWKRISQTPDRIDQLEKRIKNLENRLSNSADKCPKCKQMTLELEDMKVTEPLLNLKSYFYKCSNCGFKDVKSY